MKKIAVLVLNDFIHDSRVLKESMSLSSLHDVNVYCVGSTEDNFSDFSVKSLVKYSRPGNFLLKKLAQLFVYITYFLRVLIEIRKFDAVHCNDLETLPIGVVGKVINRKLTVIYDSHEYQTETLWMQNKLKKFLARRLESFFIKYADKVIVVSDSIADEYAKNYEITKPTVILNAPNKTVLSKSDILRTKFDISDDQVLFLYQGGLTSGRGIELLLEAFQQTDRKNTIVFMGNGPLKELVCKYVYDNDNIFHLDAVPQSELLSYTQSADYGLLFYEDNCLNHRFCSPNKIFEYINSGLPVIISNLFEMRRLVQTNDIGMVVEDNTIESLLECVESSRLLDYGSLVHNVNLAARLYNWETQEFKLLELYR